MTSSISLLKHMWFHFGNSFAFFFCLGVVSYLECKQGKSIIQLFNNLKIWDFFLLRSITLFDLLQIKLSFLNLSRQQCLCELCWWWGRHWRPWWGPWPARHRRSAAFQLEFCQRLDLNWFRCGSFHHSYPKHSSILAYPRSHHLHLLYPWLYRSASSNLLNLFHSISYFIFIE